MTYSAKLCFGPCRQVKSVDEFYVRPENGRLYSWCKKCHNYRSNGPKRTIPVSYLKPFLEEIVVRCGSERKAAKRIGVAKTQLRNWLGLTKRKQKSINKTSARKIMDTLLQLRQANVHYIHEHQPGPKPPWLSVDNAEAERKREERGRAA